MGVNDQQIHSVIVFIGDSTFKTDMPENVIYGGGYLRYIKSKSQPVLSESEVNEITSKIESGRLTPSFKTNREHVAHVRNEIAEKENNIGEAPPAKLEASGSPLKGGRYVGKAPLGLC